jgi:hypothetical protein
MTDTLWSALAELQTQLPRIAKPKTAVVKTKTGGEYKYKYENLGQISAEILPLLGKLGLSWVTMPTLNVNGQFVLRYVLTHASNNSMSGEYPLPASGTPQEMGSAITYARRYCLCAVTGVAPDDDDDDGAAASKARPARVQKTTPRDTATSTPVDMAPGGGITSLQMRHMQALFGDMKITDRGNKLAYAIDVVKRQIDSATQLTEPEADEVIASLKRWKAQDTPPGSEGE